MEGLALAVVPARGNPILYTLLFHQRNDPWRREEARFSSAHNVLRVTDRRPRLAERIIVGLRGRKCRARADVGPPAVVRIRH